MSRFVFLMPSPRFVIDEREIAHVEGGVQVVEVGYETAPHEQSPGLPVRSEALNTQIINLTASHGVYQGRHEVEEKPECHDGPAHRHEPIQPSDHALKETILRNRRKYT